MALTVRLSSGGSFELPFTQDSPAGMAGQQCGESIQAYGAHPPISIRCGGFSIDFNDGVDEKQLSIVLRVLKYTD